MVPIFRRQIAAGGPVTVTDPRMKRYFMTIPEAVQLIIRAGSLSLANAELFVLEMGEPVRIIDLAETMIRLSGFEPERDIAIEIVGARPGEKLHEELFNPYERPQPTPVQKILRAGRDPVDVAWVERTFDELNLLVLEDDAAALAQHVVPAGSGPASGRGRERPDWPPRLAAMGSMPFAFSVHNFISSVGADAGFAAIIGLAVLVLLYFAHARETANLREEASILAERLQQAEARVAELSRPSRRERGGPRRRGRPGDRPARRRGRAASVRPRRGGRARAGGRHARGSPCRSLRPRPSPAAPIAAPGGGRRLGRGALSLAAVAAAPGSVAPPPRVDPGRSRASRPRRAGRLPAPATSAGARRRTAPLRRGEPRREPTAGSRGAATGTAGAGRPARERERCSRSVTCHR